MNEPLTAKDITKLEHAGLGDAVTLEDGRIWTAVTVKGCPGCKYYNKHPQRSRWCEMPAGSICNSIYRFDGSNNRFLEAK